MPKYKVVCSAKVYVEVECSGLDKACSMARIVPLEYWRVNEKGLPPDSKPMSIERQANGEWGEDIETPSCVNGQPKCLGCQLCLGESAE